MADYREHFGDFGGRIWLGASHQGPLPNRAATEAHEAIAWKQSPHELTTDRFSAVPRRLKQAIGRVVGLAPDEIILSNGSSRGLHILANGLPLDSGDEVLVVRDDFPSNRLPWIGLAGRGVAVRTVEPARHLPTVDEVAALITPATRVLCLSWVHSFSGWVSDLDGIGALCRERGVLLVANLTQGVGARPIDLSRLPVDAAVCSGWKWLCGPYATGFAWFSPGVLDALDYNQYYWLSAQTADDLGRQDGSDPPAASGAARYDIFGTANFFNFKPWAAAIELIAEIGVEAIAAHDQALVQQLVDGLADLPYDLISPVEPADRSTLVFASHADPARNHEIHAELARQGIDASFRAGRLRFAPHLYNTAAEIERVLEALRSLG